VVRHARFGVAGFPVGIQVQSPAKGVLLRENSFVNVTRPLDGDGLATAVVVPGMG
jgi:hypothetical protein